MFRDQDLSDNNTNIRPLFSFSFLKIHVSTLLFKMSSITVDGIVEIAMGKRYLPPNPPTGAKSLHIHYIQTASGAFDIISFFAC